MRSIRSTRFWRPCPGPLGGMGNGIPELTHLSGPRREILKRPPGPLLFLRLFKFLSDLHGRGGKVRLRGRNKTQRGGEGFIFRLEAERRHNGRMIDSSPVERLFETGETRVNHSPHLSLPKPPQATHRVGVDNVGSHFSQADRARGRGDVFASVCQSPLFAIPSDIKC